MSFRPLSPSYYPTKFISFMPANLLPQGIQFPKLDRRWTLKSMSSARPSEHIVVWEKDKLGKNEEDFMTSFKCLSHLVYDVSLKDYCAVQKKHIEAVSQGELKVIPVEGLFVKWIQKIETISVYVFTRVLGRPPFFFILQFQTKDLFQYTAQNSLYVEILMQAKIVYSP